MNTPPPSTRNTSRKNNRLSIFETFLSSLFLRVYAPIDVTIDRVIVKICNTATYGNEAINKIERATDFAQSGVRFSETQVKVGPVQYPIWCLDPEHR